MESVRPITNETSTLDLPSSSRTDTYSSALIRHPFVLGFGQSINTVIRATKDFIKSHNTGISAAIDSITHRIKPFINPLKADPIQANIPVDKSQELNESAIHKPSTDVGETIRDEHRAHPKLKTEAERDEQLSKRVSSQKPNEQRGLETTRPISRSATKEQQLPLNLENIQPSTVGLKFSHSRLEGTDLAIDAALIASGMGGVLIMEHLIDMALHTRFKKEPIRNHKQTMDPSKNSSNLKSNPNKASVDHAIKNDLSNTSSLGVIAKEIKSENNTHETRIRFKR